jgi:purine-binding chemotaxis protein CheW
MTPETKRVLKARAQALARAANPVVARNAVDVIEFVLAYETYAVESRLVREVHRLKDLTPLPCTPRHVVGIVNIRGQIVSVIDIKKLFELPDKGLTDLNRVIVLRSETMEFGILADAVLGTASVVVEELQPPLPTLTGIREQYLKGITTDRVVVLDAGKLLADPGIVVNEEMTT